MREGLRVGLISARRGRDVRARIYDSTKHVA